MATKHETIETPRHELTVSVPRVTRSQAGSWSCTLDITGSIFLEDGRELPINRELSVRSLQKGKKGAPPRARAKKVAAGPGE